MNKNKKYFLIYVVNILLGLLYISPLIWMVVSAFKPENRIFADMSKGLAAFWPAGATLDNFKEVFVRSNMPRYILNSVTYVTILVFLSMAVNSAFGYALAKFEFKGKNVILTVVLSLLVLPLESILLSLFFIVNKLGWVDSYLALIIPFIVKCFDVYLFRQFFLDVPDDLIEAAEIDGAGPFKTFLQVIIPVSKPVFATVFILDYVAYWSDFMWPLLVITDAGKRTVQLGIQTFFTEPPVYYGPIMAALTKETLGIPVIAIGVPTVVEAAAIIYDAQGNCEQMPPHLNGMFVTPKNIDELIKQLSFTLSEALNMVFTHGER